MHTLKYATIHPGWMWKAAAAEPRASRLVFIFENDLGCPLVLNLLLLSLFPLSLLNIHLVDCICFSQEMQPHHELIMSLVATQPRSWLMVDLTLPSSGRARGAVPVRHQPINMVTNILSFISHLAFINSIQTINSL